MADPSPEPLLQEVVPQTSHSGRNVLMFFFLLIGSSITIFMRSVSSASINITMPYLRDQGGGQKPKNRVSTWEYGVIMKWNDEKGIFFVKPKVGGEMVFAHVSKVASGRDGLRIGDEVTFRRAYIARKTAWEVVEVYPTTWKNYDVDEAGGLVSTREEETTTPEPEEEQAEEEATTPEPQFDSPDLASATPGGRMGGGRAGAAGGGRIGGRLGGRIGGRTGGRLGGPTLFAQARPESIIIPVVLLFGLFVARAGFRRFY
eukprot:gnl/MRDRNA2_/MRDRNA2_50764_c0_seq1.p1 gnl/MRDRNA2_/MRDRNA2_50764_c0~~gnl/MRDRNA2_/MRDRNA2_50764_c0_seq1.p1  ORF type:complete len:259 (+),score=34.80 gnl/MRDRNA2_/MRDRNA2_50764_c0_seq1:80-856(+)